MLAPVLAVAILLGYGAALWWLLRRESAVALAWLVGLTGLSVALRLAYTTEYPDGMNEDEVKILWCSIDLLRHGRIFVDDCTGIPAMLSVLFDAQLAEWIGPTRWAVRGLSFLGGTLAVPAAFAAARSLGVRVAASLLAAGLVAVLPWALFYGRVHQSGELVFETLLVAACLGRFLRARGGWVEALIGGFALTLLLQTYYSGRAIFGLALVAVVLAPGRYRLWCLALAAVAVVGWLPYWASGAPFALVGVSGTFVQPGMANDPVAMVSKKAWQAFEALLAPVAYDQWLTIRAAAMHPPWVLGLAALGTLTGVRRFLFLWAGFLGGIAPSVLGYSPLPSARRMLLGFPFICLAAACALDVIPWRRVRVPLCAAVFAVTAIASTRLFFSQEFWRPESAWVFDAARWNLVESLPAAPHPHLIITRDLGYFFAPLSQFDKDFEILSVESWYPRDQTRAIYAFGPEFGALEPLYLSLFGPQRVRTFGGSFRVDVEEADWSWMKAYGWTYQAACGADVRTAQVPFLVLQDVTIGDFQCPGTSTHVWSGRWQGPPSTLRFYSRGAVSMEVDGKELGSQQGWDTVHEFKVQTGSRIVARTSPMVGAPAKASLVRVVPTGLQAPFFEWVVPEPPAKTG